MPFWFTFALFAISFVATALLAPRPNIENAKPGQLGDFRFPRNDEGAPVPIFWGRVRLRGGNTLFYGNLRARAIREKVKTGLFRSKRVTVGHTYSLTIHMGFGLLTGSSSTIRRIWFGDKLAWSGAGIVGGGPDGESFQIFSPGLFGGFKEGGGVQGTVTYYPGTFTQTQNSHLSTVVPDGTLLPAYRGLAGLVFENFTVGESPSVAPINVELEAIPNFLGLGGVGPSGDANPAEVLFDIFSNGWGRVGLPSTALNGASFISAGTTLAAENHGISLAIQSPNDARDVIQEVLQQVDGLIYEDPFTREINFTLIRDDYVIANLPVFDESNVREIGDYSVTMWNDTFNQARVIYTDRDSDYKDKTAFAQDLANITFQNGRIRSADYRYPGISNSTLANQIVARELNLTSIPLIKLRMTANREGSQLRPGDVFVLNWPDFNVTNLVMRVQRFDLGTLDDNRVVIDCVQDRFAVSQVVFAPPPQTDWVAPDVTPQVIANRRILEMPRFLNLQLLADPQAALGTDPDDSYLQHLGQEPNVNHTSFEAQVSEDAGVSFQTDNPFTSFTVTGLLNAAVGEFTAESFMATSPFVLKSVNDETVFDVPATEADRRAGANLILINDELISFGSVTDNMDGTFTLGNVSRGVLDTSPRAHAEDDRVWFISSVDLENMGEANFNGSESLRVRLLSQTGFGNLTQDAAPIDTVQLQERPQLPYPPLLLTIAGQAYPATLNTGDNPFDVTFSRRNRTNTQVRLTDDGDEAPEAGVQYFARFTVDGGMATTSLIGSTATGSIDFGTTPGAVALEVFSRDSQSRECLFPVRRNFTLEAGGGPGAVSFIDSASQTIATSASNINVAFPGTFVSGDLLLMQILARGNITTPTGWTLEHVESDATGAGASITRCAWFSRISDGTESGTVNVVQASAARMIGQMMAVRTTAGTYTVTLADSGSQVSSSGNLVSIGDIPAVAADGMVVLGSAALIAQTSGTTDITAQGAYIQVSPVTIAQNRMFMAYQIVTSGFSDALVQYQTNVSGSSSRSATWAHLFVTP